MIDYDDESYIIDYNGKILMIHGDDADFNDHCDECVD